MNRRIILLVILVLLGALAWWLARKGEPTTLSKPLSDFAIADTSTVKRIFITDHQGRSVDLRRAGDHWTLDGKYTARHDLITTALKTFLRVEVKSPVPKSSEDMVLRTMGSSSLKVEIYQGNAKPTKTWIVGHATKDHFGTYMVLEKAGEGRSSVPFIMGIGGFTGILNTRFPTDPDAWRSTEIFRFHDLYDLARVEVEHPASPGSSYRIENGTDRHVKLTDLAGKPLPADTVLVKGALMAFRMFDFEFFDRQIKRTSRDSLLKAQPNFIVRATPRKGPTQTVKLWYMPYSGEETGFENRPLHDHLRMHALVQDTVLVVVQRQYTDLMTQPASALMP